MEARDSTFKRRSIPSDDDCGQARRRRIPPVLIALWFHVSVNIERIRAQTPGTANVLQFNYAGAALPGPPRRPLDRARHV